MISTLVAIQSAQWFQMTQKLAKNKITKLVKLSDYTCTRIILTNYGCEGHAIAGNGNIYNQFSCKLVEKSWNQVNLFLAGFNNLESQCTVGQSSIEWVWCLYLILVKSEMTRVLNVSDYQLLPLKLSLKSNRQLTHFYCLPLLIWTWTSN